MPKEIYSSKLGTVKLYSVEELAGLMKLPPDEVRARLKSGKLKAQKIKDGWHVPEEIIAEQARLVNRLAAAGTRVSKNRKAQKTALFASIGVVALVALITLIAMFRPAPVMADACDSPGMEGFVLKELADSALVLEVRDIVGNACAGDGAMGSSDSFRKCADFVRRPRQGLVKLARLAEVRTRSANPESLFCSATLKAATVPINIEYVVTLKDGVAKSATVSLVR